MTLLSRLPLLAYGFRPFFLLGAGYAVIVLWPWIASLLQLSGPGTGLPPLLWHGHEMLYGFAFAALAGFLLTALPSWTDAPSVSGGRLAALVGLWLIGRGVFWAGLTGPWLALGSLLFPVVLTLHVIQAFAAAGGRRHLDLALAYVLLVASQFLFHAAVHWDMPFDIVPVTVLHAAANLFLLLIVLTTSRIIRVVVPAALEHSGLSPRFQPSLARERMAVTALALYLLADLIFAGHPAAGWVALAAAAAQADRLSEWPWGRPMLQPYLLFLATAHLCMTAGLIIVGLVPLVDDLPVYAGRHLLFLGAMGAAILAVFCIAGLRHTGRGLQFPAVTWAAFACLLSAAVLRTAVPLLLPAYYLPAGIILPALLWSLAFGLYLFGFGRYLLSRRADGRPG